jgi:hypothetical protein
MSKVFILNRISLDPDGYFNVTDFIAASLTKDKLLLMADGVLVDLSLKEHLHGKVKCVYSISEYYELSEITLI